MNLSFDERETLRDVCEVLRPLEEVTREMCAEKSVTISKIIPITQNMKSVSALPLTLPRNTGDLNFSSVPLP